MDIEALNKMLSDGQDNLLLRFALAQALFKQGQYADAIGHLETALEHDKTHTASLKLLGKALAANGDNDKAMQTYRRGIEIAGEPDFTLAGMTKAGMQATHYPGR